MAQTISQYSGRRGVVKVGPTPTVVALVRSFSVEEIANTDDDSRMGEDWDRMHVLSFAWNGTLTVRDNPADPGQALLVVGDEVDVELFTTGEISTREKLSGTVLITNLSRGADQGSPVERTYTFNGQGELTKEQIV